MPLYNSYTPVVRVNKGAPTSALPSEDQVFIVNTTSQTAVDGNAQSLTDGIGVAMNGNGAFVGLAISNKNAGILASADLIFLNDATTDKFNGPVFDIGQTSSTGANPAYPVLPIGGYIFNTSYPIGIGTLSASDIIFHTNGAALTNERLRIKSTGPTLLQNATTVSAGGATTSYLGVSSTIGLGLYWGSGVPTVSAAQGSLYIRTDGSSIATRMYINTNGTTGWTNVVTAA